MLSSFFRRLLSRAEREMQPGDQYCRAHGRRVLETATILDLRPDLVGIPHVHFTVAFERSSADALDGGPRTLALSRFVDEYHRQAS